MALHEQVALQEVVHLAGVIALADGSRTVVVEVGSEGGEVVVTHLLQQGEYG
jgi:hypothetical protein